MVHPYKAISTGDALAAIRDRVERGPIKLTPIEEHYFKKSLLKNEILSEMNSMSPDYNDTSGLRRFGPPFVPADPRYLLQTSDHSMLDQIYTMSEASIEVFRNQFPILRFIFENFIITFPFIKIHLQKLGDSVMDQSKFWLKIQILFELFKSKRISNSNDRGTTSKRKLLLYKIQALFLGFFNSSIYAIQDPQYFEMDKERRGALKKLNKFVDTAEAETMKKGDLGKEDLNKSDVFLDMSVSSEALLNHLSDVEDDDYVNGWHVNVIGVSVENETKNTFWGTTDAKYYCFIVYVKPEGGKGWFIKRRYSEFAKLHDHLKKENPACHVPDLPSKDKQSVEMNLSESLDDKKIDANRLVDFGENAIIDDEFNDIDEESVEALFVHESLPSPTASVMSNGSGSNSGSTKTPKVGFGGFSKPSFLKSPKGSPRMEKSIFNAFKKHDNSTSKSKPMSLAPNLSSHQRTDSVNSNNSQLSDGSIVSSTDDATFHSVNTSSSKVSKKGNIVFPREILRQSLRGFLKFVIHNKKLAKSKELYEFLNENHIQLTDSDLTDAQNRLHLDHLRTVQHVKFQSALIGIVKVLEKDVESFKEEIYNGGFSYVFDNIQKYGTLHELCGYSQTDLERVTWLSAIGDDITTDPAAAPLRGLVRILMLEIASTQYELLIGSDSAASTLKTIRRLHSMFPYRLVAGVLRFTNPLMMVKRMIDVFTYQMPSVSNGMNGIGDGLNGMMSGLGLGWKKDERKETKKAVNKSLFQMIFSSMLGDDIKKLENEKSEVKSMLKESHDGETIMQRIDKYFQSNDETVLHIKKMSLKMGIDISVAIMMPNNGLQGCADLGTTDLYQIIREYGKEKRHSQLEDEEEDEDEEGGNGKLAASASLYKLLLRYFHIQLRLFDKESMIELINEPELMSVVKEMISLLLSPLIDLFKKAEVYKYVPIFAKYMGELLNLCERYSADYGEFERSDVVSSLVGLEEKYSEYCYKFVRDLYLNDIERGYGKSKREDRLFEGLVEWLNKVVAFLRYVKKDKPELMIDLSKMINGLDLDVAEKVKLLAAIEECVKSAERKRVLMEKMELQGKLEGEDAVTGKGEAEKDWTRMIRDKKVDEQWDAIHGRILQMGEKVTEGEGDSGFGIFKSIEVDEYDDADAEENSATTLEACHYNEKAFLSHYNANLSSIFNRNAPPSQLYDEHMFAPAVCGAFMEEISPIFSSFSC